MEKITSILILAFVLAIYFLLFNVIASLDMSFVGETLNSSVGYSTTEQASVGDSVEVMSFHDGLFWNIQTFHYTDHKDSTLYLLGFVPLPLVIYNLNLLYLHVVVGSITSIIFIIIIFSERGYYE